MPLENGTEKTASKLQTIVVVENRNMFRFACQLLPISFHFPFPSFSLQQQK